MGAAEFKAARDFLLAHRTDYDAACRGFRWPAPTHFNWALDWFDAELVKDDSATGPALTIVGDGATSLTFAALSERSNRLANALRARGVQRGDRVLVMLGNVAPLWETMLAVMKLGAVVIPAATLLTPADLADRFARGRAKHVVAAAGDAGKFESFKQKLTRIAVGDAAAGWERYDDLLKSPAAFTPDAETNADDPMLLYFTSGTTAKPKLVLHSHRTYPIGHLATMYALGLMPGDIHLNVASPGWAKHAWSSFFSPWNAGATVCAFNQPRFDAKALLAVVASQGVTSLCAPPTVWRMLIQEDLGAVRHSLREVIAAGEPLNPEVIGKVRDAWGLTIRDFYGQTETAAQIGNSPGQTVKPGSMGRALPGFRIRLVDANGKDVQEGQIAIALDPAPAGLMRGYQQEDGSITSLAGTVYRTGDVATRDAEGYITYVGRADDVFKASDYRISPFELESVLIEHPAVAEAAVVPAPDPLRLAVAKAYVSLVPGAAADRATALSIFRHIRDRLAPFKRVRRLEFANLPKTISGKIRRVELRREEEVRATAGSRTAGEFREEDFPELKQGAAPE
jgi:acetyl-CoA synthetase